MRTFRKDIKEHIESITGVVVYPTVVPDKAKYPCIEMNISGGGRDGDSSLTDSKIREYRLTLTILFDPSSMESGYQIEESLEALQETQLSTVSTDTMIIYFDNSVELFNYSTNLYELTVDLKIKKLN